jgi:Ni/Co efflux regulator RcnB
MKTKAMVCALAALSMTISSATFAQPRDGGDRGRDGGAQTRGGGDRDRGSDMRGGGGDRDRGSDLRRGDGYRGSDARGGDDRYRGGEFRRGRDDDRGDRWRHGSRERSDRDWGRHDNDRREARGGGPNRNWYRGDRLPPEYRTRHYVVNDWRGHRLSAPPRGYQWVQAGSDYVLVAIATGVIAQLLLR